MDESAEKPIFTAMNYQIDEHREKIDQLDSDILNLILKRVKETGEILTLKAKAGAPTDTRQREEEIFERLIKESGGAIQADSIRVIWQVIISMGKAEFQRRSESEI